MILSMRFQIALACISFTIGIMGAFVYDMVRIIRVFIVHSVFAIAVEDLLFWILFSIFTFLIFLRVNYGEIRIFMLFSVFLAMVLYYSFASKIVWNIFLPIYQLISRVFYSFLTILATPFILLCKPIGRFFELIIKFFKNYLQNAGIYEKIQVKIGKEHNRGVIDDKTKTTKKK